MPFPVHRILLEREEKEIKWLSQRKNKPQSVSGNLSKKESKNLENTSLMFSSCNPFPSKRSAAKHAF